LELGLKDKNVVVTASSKGIGYAIAERLAEEGANLLLCSRSADGIQAAADRLSRQYGVRAYGIQADMSDSAQIDGVIDFAAGKFPALHGLVCNTGGPPAGKFLEMTDEQWGHAYHSILMSAVRLVRGLHPLLSREGGRVLAVASTSVKEPIAGLVLSNVFRAGIAGLMKT